MVSVYQSSDPSTFWSGKSFRIETDVSGYAIDAVSSQLNLDSYASLNQWHSVAYFSKKIIPAETQYKTHNVELLAIIETF